MFGHTEAIFSFTLTILNILAFKQNLEQDDIINCAIRIANENFSCRELTVVLYSEERLVTKFLMEYKGTITIGTKTLGTTPKQVVVITDNYKSFVRMLNKLNPELGGKNLLNGSAKFLIILNSTHKKLGHVTKIFWSYYVTNVVIVTKDTKGGTALYTYFPYKNYLDCQNTEPVLIDYWNTGVNFAELYPDKMMNMHECPFYISTNKIHHQVEEQKIELQIIKKTIVQLLRKIMNFTPIVLTRDYLSVDSDRAKNWSDSLSDLTAGLANISTCTIPLGVERLGVLDYSMPYFRVRIVWLAPPVAPGPPWWRLLSPLNGYLWLAILVVVFIVISLPLLTKFKPLRNFCYRYFKNYGKIQGVAFRVWGVMTGQTIKMAPMRFRDFYIISLWMWFTFVVRNAYQSVLIGALKTETLVGNFANLQETVDNGYKFGGRAGIYAYFESDPLIRDGFELVPESKFEDVFHDVMEGRKKFVVATSLEYVFTYCVAQGKAEVECGRVLPDSILTVPLVVWVKMHSPLAKTLSVWLPRFIEHGLLERDAIMKTSCTVTVNTDPLPLTMHQTLSCFLCLALGYTIAFIALLLEKLRYKTSKYTIVKRFSISSKITN